MAQQCNGTNVRGKRCKRLSKVGEYCVYHKAQASSETSEKAKPDKSSEKAKPDKPSDECSVCYEQTKHALDCTHYVCESCIGNIRQDACPMCRAPLKGECVTPKLLQDIQRKMLEDIEARNAEAAQAYAQNMRRAQDNQEFVQDIFQNGRPGEPLYEMFQEIGAQLRLARMRRRNTFIQALEEAHAFFFA